MKKLRGRMHSSEGRKMKALDYIVLAVFVVALIILCFFQQCTLDIFILVFGFVVAAMSAIAMFLQNRKKKDEQQE